ncbi:MAG TPA: PAS domain S-box protein [Verrucomicrobiae bacterium]|jgi:PAS domain S-box-containing protein|nr:PAS domain S-box protein [Verrucomicrobiae bacterium]
MKIPVENKILAGFVVTALALGIMGWLSYRATKDFITAQNWVTHSQEVITRLQAMLATVVETDTEERGYLLTSDTTFLKARSEAAAKLPDQLEQLKELTSDNPTQQDFLNQFDAQSRALLALGDERITAFQKSGLQEARSSETMQKTKLALAAVQYLTAEMYWTEQKLLVQRREQARITGNRTELAVISGNTFAVVIGGLAVFLSRRDLKRRSHAETALQQNEERFRLMISAIRDYAVIRLDLDGRVASWNEGAYRIKGYTADEIIGQHVSKFYPPEAVESGTPQHLLALAAENGHAEDTGWRVRKDGSRFWAHVTIARIRNPKEELLGFVKVTRDLTERRHAEEVQEERDRYFDLSRELICVLGFDGYFKNLNPAWKWTLGFSTEEMMARPYMEFVHPDDRAATEAEDEKLKKGGETIYFENRLLCKDNTWRWFAWSARAALPQNVIYGTGRDISERKLAHEKIEKLNADLQSHTRQLEETNKELEAFSYSVSHDLRAPLRHIDGFVKMLVKQSGPQLDDRGKRYLDIIADSAQKMGNLIDDLLVFSRMSRAELRRTRVSTDSLVHEAVEGLQTDINGRHIDWKIAALPEVDADPAMLQQVWVNLIANAVKYTRPRDPAKIEIGCEDSGNGEYVFFVHDNGVGFDMQYAHKLFGVFQRLHRAEEFEGTGIGLANVGRIVHRHGGRVWAEGRPDAGATFYFSLPKTSTESKV